MGLDPEEIESDQDDHEEIVDKWNHFGRITDSKHIRDDAGQQSVQANNRQQVSESLIRTRLQCI